MENQSFAEIKERFNKMNVLPYPRPRTPTIDNESPSISNPTVSEKSKTEASNQSFGNTQPKASSFTTTSSEKSNETASTIQAGLARVLQQGAVSLPSSKKAPVPLPRPPIQPRKESISQQVLPSHVNTVPASNPSSVVPSVINHSDEDTYAELPDEPVNPSISSETSSTEISYESFSKPSPVIANIIASGERRNSHSESLSMSLDTMLPLKCMFFDFETTINEYRRRDPRTIIYPKFKVSMPKITSHEISTLQRYSNA